MKSNQFSYSRHYVTYIALLLISLLAVSAYGQQNSTLVAKSASALSEEERKVSRFVNVTTIRDVAKTLVSDEMQGRGTATAGGEKAAVYIGDQFAKLGLKPIGDAGRFLQPIKFNSSQVLSTSSIKVGE